MTSAKELRVSGRPRLAVYDGGALDWRPSEYRFLKTGHVACDDDNRYWFILFLESTSPQLAALRIKSQFLAENLARFIADDSWQPSRAVCKLFERHMSLVDSFDEIGDRVLLERDVQILVWQPDAGAER
jgi:hypothetical protein